MVANQTITDLKVKQLIVRWRTGTGSYRSSGQPIFTVGKDYRLSVVYGNTSNPVVYEGDLYDKEDLRISLNPLGILTSSGYIHRDALQFYDGASFSTPVPHPPEHLYPGPYKTTHTNRQYHLFFRPTPPIQSFPVNRFRFVAIISAAIRRRRSHQVITQV